MPTADRMPEGSQTVLTGRSHPWHRILLGALTYPTPSRTERPGSDERDFTTPSERGS